MAGAHIVRACSLAALKSSSRSACTSSSTRRRRPSPASSPTASSCSMNLREHQQCHRRCFLTDLWPTTYQAHISASNRPTDHLPHIHI